jgi:hypothetical protein
MLFSFGNTEQERIEIDILRYERAPVGEYYDDNWLMSQIRVRVGGFHGKINASFLTVDLITFLTQLRPLFNQLIGTAEFSTLEEQLHLTLTADGKGRCELTGEVSDQPGIGNQLQFSLQFDQSQLGRSIRELESVTEEFPVRTI